MTEEFEELLKEVHVNQVKLLDALGKKDEPPRDRWDKFSAISPFITGIAGVLIALVGIYFTYSFNQRQREDNQMQQERETNLKARQAKVSEIQAVSSFLPQLAGSEKNKEVAILMIAELTTPELAAKIIATLGGPGAVSAGESLLRSGPSENARVVRQALISISKTGKEDDKKLAEEVLTSVFRGYTYMGVQGEKITVEVVPHEIGLMFLGALDGNAISGNPFSFNLKPSMGSSMLLSFEFSFLANSPNDAYYEIKVTGNNGTASRLVLRSDPITNRTFKFQTVK